MTCVDVRLDEYLDGELAEPDRRSVEAHLASCGPCRADLERSRKLETLLQGVPSGALPDADRFLNAVRLRSRRAFPWPMAAAAALLLAGLAVLLLQPRRLSPEELQAGLARYAARPDAAFEADVRRAGDAGRRQLEKALEGTDVRLQFAAATLLFKTSDEATRERVLSRFDSRKATNGAWVLGDAGAEDSDLELVPVAVSALQTAGQERWAMDVLRRLNRMGSQAQSEIVHSVVTLLMSDHTRVQKLALDIVKELDIEFPLPAIVDLLDSPELGDEALRILRQATRKDLGKDKAAWLKAIE